MSALPVTIDPRAADDIRALPPELRPAVLEHLSRIAADYRSCSRATSFPHPPGLESGLWLRRTDASVVLLQVLFYLTVAGDRIYIRRVLTTSLDRQPDWLLRPSEWPDATPWPIVEL